MDRFAAGLLTVLVAACGASGGGGAPTPGTATPGSGGSSGGTVTGGTTSGTTGGGSSLGGTTTTGSGGVGLYSSVFEPAAGAGGGLAVVPECDYVTTPGCDYTRVTGCCEPLSCAHASTDPWDTYPIDTCNALLTCVQNAACTTAADPLCLMDEAGPCMTETYNAQFQEVDGIYAWTKTLMNCICGY